VPQWGQLKQLSWTFSLTFITIGLANFYGQYFSYDHMSTEEFANDSRGFFYRASYAIMCMEFMWATYYSGFCLMESSMISCGMSYSPKTEKSEETFRAIKAVDIIACETAHKTELLMGAWNIQIHNWLKYYVMLRVLDKKKDRRVM